MDHDIIYYASNPDHPWYSGVLHMEILEPWAHNATLLLLRSMELVMLKEDENHYITLP